MARSLEFNYLGSSFKCEIKTVNRSKLYGSVDIETLDADGGVCALASLANDGKTLIPLGGTASAYVNEDGEWLLRKDLTAVDEEGEERDLVASSFDTVLLMDNEVTVEEFLDHSIRLSYLLVPEGDWPEGFPAALQGGVIFRTGFSYRGGVDADPAFVLQGDDEGVWLLIGSRNKVRMVNLEAAASCASNHELDGIDDEDEQELDELSFDVL